MEIYMDGCIDGGETYEIAVYQGRTVEFDPQDGYISITKDGISKTMSYDIFEDMFHIINETLDAALKEDCIFYRVIDGDVLIKNYRGDERLISMNTFLSMYTI